VGLQEKAQTRSQKISDEDCDSEADRSEPPPRSDILQESTLSPFQGTLQHIAIFLGD
jgi:hypothetical protein